MARVTQNERHLSYPGDSVNRLLDQGDLAGAKAELERLILEGIDSGDTVEATPEFWADLKEKLHRDAAERKSKKSA
jgi:hypothetical protein